MPPAIGSRFLAWLLPVWQGRRWSGWQCRRLEAAKTRSETRRRRAARHALDVGYWVSLNVAYRPKSNACWTVDGPSIRMEFRRTLAAPGHGGVRAACRLRQVSSAPPPQA